MLIMKILIPKLWNKDFDSENEMEYDGNSMKFTIDRYNSQTKNASTLNNVI